MKIKTRISLALSLCAVLVLAVVAFWPVVRAELLTWDDNVQVTDNPDIRSLDAAGVHKIFTSFYVAMYQPLATLSYALEYRLVGLHPWLYHVDNLALHLANCLLVWWLSLLLFRQRRVALLSALLFALWPTQVEVVAWISCRSTLLASGLMLGALISALYYWRRQRLWQLLLVHILFILAILAKPLALIFVGLLALLALREGKFRWKLVYELAPVLIISVVFGVVAMAGRQFSGVIEYHYFNLWKYLAVVGYSFCWQLYKLVWPFSLSNYYSIPVILEQLPAYVYWSALASVLILLLAMASLRYKKSFFAWWFIINISISLLVTPYNLQTGADRYNYLACLALIWPLSLLACHLWPAGKARYYYSACLLLGLMLVVNARSLTAVWHDDIALWRNAATANPSIAAVWYNLGSAYYKQGDWKKAYEAAEYTRLANPFGSDAYVLRGRLKMTVLKDSSGALRDFAKATQLKANNPSAQYNLGLAQLQAGQLAGAAASFEQAIIDNTAKPAPDQEELANAYFMLGQTYLRQNKWRNAERMLTQAIEIDRQQTDENSTNYSAALFARGLARQVLHHPSACADFRSAADLGQTGAKVMLKGCPAQ